MSWPRGSDVDLCVALLRDDQAAVEQALAAGARIDSADDDGFTPLCIAAKDGLIALTEKLLAAGADVHHTTTSGATALCEAVSKGHTAIVERLIDAGASVEVVDNDGNSALHRAALGSHLDVARVLIDAGADRSIRNRRGMTALDVFDLSGHIAVLLCRRSPPPATFFRAVQRGDLTLVSRLANAFFVKTVDDRGRTALHYAVESPAKTPEIKHIDGSTPSTGASPSAKTEDSRIDVLRVLLAVDCVNLNAQDRDGQTALLTASGHGDARAVRLLLDHGASITLADKDGRTPLSVAKSPEVRWILQAYTNSQRYHDQCFALMANQEMPPSIQQIADLVPLITSVYDLRLLITLTSLCGDRSPHAATIKSAFHHVIANNLTFDDNACVFFKLILERCERDSVISREDFLLLDRKAEKANTESSDWVFEIKKQVNTNSWRLDAHDHHMRTVVESINYVHSMVLENRAAVVATSGRVEQLQSQVVLGRHLLNKLMMHAKYASEEVTRIQKRLAQANDHIQHIARHLTNFRDAYEGRLEQEAKNQKIKRVCGVVASVAGFVIGPVLKEISDAVVDFTKPIDIVSTLYGERDIAGFLAEQSKQALPDVIKSQLEKYAIPQDEFETLLREEIALLHPEIVAECADRGLELNVDGGRSEKVQSVVQPLLEAEEVAVAGLLHDLHSALREGSTKREGSASAEVHLAEIARHPLTISSSPLTMQNVEPSTVRSPTAIGSVEPLAPEVVQAPPPHDDTDQEQESPCITVTLEALEDPEQGSPIEALSSPNEDGAERCDDAVELNKSTMIDDVEDPEQHIESVILRRLSDDTSQDQVDESHAAGSSVPFTSARSYHAAVEQSQGDLATFKVLTHHLDADVTMPATVQLRTTQKSRETLCAAQYAYARGNHGVAQYLASQMATPPPFESSRVVSIVLAEPTDAFAYVCIVDECRDGDVDECALLCELMERDGHALDAAIAADVEREIVQVATWTPVEYACRLGYVDLVKYMLKELDNKMPPKLKIDLMRRVRDHAAVADAA